MSHDQSPLTDQSSLIGLGTVAALCGDCSKRHIMRLADAGKMPRPIKLGALLRWRRDEIERWVADGCPAVRVVTGNGVR